ncbi:MAG: hypothetical protein J6B53_08140 [Clostridia bacterium]|nr:hypothetical protein [Clostridia bacterium]
MNYVACIAEGGAETAIIDILLDHHLLIFDREEMLDEQVLRCRSASMFESKYLRKGFSGKITVYRILDSRRENFRMSKAYEHKVDVINVVTAPEIEMLIILNENRYVDFKKSGMKPSEYCMNALKLHCVKSYDFVKQYFSDPSVLIAAMKRYTEVSRIAKGEWTLLNLIK